VAAEVEHGQGDEASGDLKPKATRVLFLMLLLRV